LSVTVGEELAPPAVAAVPATVVALLGTPKNTNMLDRHRIPEHQVAGNANR
jgi:hypothetical protein